MNKRPNDKRMMNLQYQPTTEDDFSELVELRIESMRESLEALGRFDRIRSIERFRSSFSPGNTKKIMMEEVLVGFFATTERNDELYLNHLYVSPQHQSFGIGSTVMASLIKYSEEKMKPIRLGALKGSKSNEFYRRHGFSVMSEDEWDIYYERKNQSEQE